MLGNQSASNKNIITSKNLKLKNARLIGANCNVSSSNVNEQSDYIDEDYSDYVVKNDIPEMKLLPMDYVPKAMKPTCAPPPPPKCKCPPPNEKPKSGAKVTISEPMAVEKNPTAKGNDKYLVYKRKHSVFGATTANAPEKLKYVNGNNKKTVESSTPDAPKAKENKKKYLIFDSKKSSSKLESIQYYFDNKSYEKYVDNKLYGKLNRAASPEPLDDDADLMNGFENSRSWEYRDNSKTETKLKLFESKQDVKKVTKVSKSDESTSGASTCSSEISLKRRNCRLKPHLKFTTSKSISDLSAKTSHDVNRINQLFANAKPRPSASIADAVLKSQIERDKYKIHRKLNGVDNVAETRAGDKLLTKDNLKKYHRSSTELNIKPPVVVPVSSCGFKNCKFSNCPVSNNSASSAASAPLIDRRSKFDENFIKKFEDMRKNSPKHNNEITVNKASISVNGKSNIIVNDTRNNLTAGAHDVHIVEGAGKEREFHSKPNNQNKTTIKINESCFVVNHSNHNNGDVKINNNEKTKNIIELNSEKSVSAMNWDKNVKVKNNPLPKYDNKVDINNKIRNEENSVKIYVSASPTPSTTLSVSSSHDSSDSDKDYGYFDTSSQGRSSSPEFAAMFKKFRQMCNLNTNELGCDGAMFWNNSYFDEEDTEAMRKSEAAARGKLYACTKCHTTTEDLLSNYICICRNQVITRAFNSDSQLTLNC